MKSKNIAVLFGKSRFSPLQLERLASLGKITFDKYPKDTEVLVFSPDVVGGVVKAKSKLWQILESLPNCKYLVLGNSDYSFVDLEYCKKREIIVSCVPFWDADAKAEFIITLLLGCTRRVFINDRRTYKRTYHPELGHNFRNQTLGVVGVGPLGERVIGLAHALGCNVIFYDEKTLRIEGGHRQTLDSLLVSSDMIALCLPDNEENKGLLNKERIARLKEGSIVVNISGRNLVNDKYMNESLLERHVYSYCFEGESLINSPFQGNEFAIMFKPFSTYTHETLEKNIETMVLNLEGIVRGIPYSKVEL